MQRLLATVLNPRVIRPLFWLLLVFTLTMAFLPKPPSVPLDALGDKWEHMIAFATLTAVALVGWPESKRWRVVLLLSAIGAMIEVVQAIPDLHRDSDWRDWVADTGAILAAALVVSPIVLWLRNRTGPQA